MDRGSRSFDFEALGDQGGIAMGTWRCWLIPLVNLRWDTRRLFLSGGYGSTVSNLHFSKAIKPELCQ